MIEIANKICDLLDNKLMTNTSHKRLIEFVSDRPGHDRRYAINFDLIKKELGWLPKHSFEKAIEKAVDWYLNNKDWCEKIVKEGNYSGERIGKLY